MAYSSFSPRNVPKTSRPRRPFGPIVFFFFHKKKQKALFRFAEDYIWPITHEVVVWFNSILLFPEKEAKSVVPLRGRPQL
jgi:hypothetical protein